MDAAATIEATLAEALAQATGQDCPPRLAEAMRYAVFPGGARVRPRLCLSVAWACGLDDPHLAANAGAAIELLHCASLVHDDLPCFDDAATRRGKPAVHRAYGEPLAVLVGDALIVLAFETVAEAGGRRPARLAALTRTIARAVGASGGIAAGQAWEQESDIDLSRYHRAKTGALFAAAAVAGAAAAGATDPETWRVLGETLGEAYQVADDIRDAVASPEMIGKPAGRDEALGRPSATRSLGINGAFDRLDALVEAAVAAVPPCARRAEFRGLIRVEAMKFLPQGVGRIPA